MSSGERDGMGAGAGLELPEPPHSPEAEQAVLGSLLLDSVSNRDLLMVQDVVMVLVVAVLLVNLVVEVLYVVIDPRLRTVGGRS